VRHVAHADSELLRQDSGEPALVDHAEADDDIAEALSGPLLLLEGFEKLALGDQALLDEEIAEQDARGMPALDRRDLVLGRGSLMRRRCRL
jgi:hypothetical protein